MQQYHDAEAKVDQANKRIANDEAHFAHVRAFYGEKEAHKKQQYL